MPNDDCLRRLHVLVDELLRVELQCLDFAEIEREKFLASPLRAVTRDDVVNTLLRLRRQKRRLAEEGRQQEAETAI